MPNFVLTVQSAELLSIVTEKGNIVATPLDEAPGGVVSVSGTAPIASTGGTTPVISIAAATGAAAGSMSAADKAKLDGIAPGAAVATVTGTAPIASTGGTTPVISIAAATGAAAGSMSAADKSKLDTLGTTLNVASGAALTALSTTLYTAGALAYVASRTTFWAYQPTDAGPADGNHIAAAGGGFWVYVAAGRPSTAAAQAAWFVDDANVSTTASDDNSGATSGAALLTKAEIARRWGTWSPTLVTLDVVVTYLSSDANGLDPGFFSPNFVNGATLRHTTVLGAAAFTGTLLAVTAKSVAGNTGLSSTFTAATGAVAAHMLLVNTTRANSRAVAIANLGGGNWSLTQPLAVYTDGTVPSPTNNDAWANGDTIQGFTLLAVDLAAIGGVMAAFDASFAPSHIVERINVTDGASAAATLQVDLACNPLLVDSVFSTNVSLRGGFTAVVQSVVMGCDFTSQVAMPVDATGAVRFAGGVTRAGGLLKGVTLTNCVTVSSTALRVQDSQVPNGGNVLVLAGGLLVSLGLNKLVGTGTIFGAGTLDVQSGILDYAGAAATVLPIANIRLQSVATGYSSATSVGVTTVHGGIALSGTNLDAAAGAAGFGGYAYGGGATLSKAGVQP